MALKIGISKAEDGKGNIVAYSQGATFSKAELRKIRAPHRYELWSNRGSEPIEVIHALSDKVAKEYLKAKFHMVGLHITKVKTSSRRVK